jgi:6-phosphofructokinase
MAEEFSKTIKNHIGVLVGGGPAPGINGVISALTLEAHSRAHRMIGIYLRRLPVVNERGYQAR